MRKSVVTLGTFDGVHRGHQALIQKVVREARRHHATPSALAFDMPPRHAGQPLSHPVLITTLQEKLALLKSLGIRRVQVLVFDRRTASTPATQFFEKTIQRRHRAMAVVVGPKLAFGRNREGTLNLLRKLGRDNGVQIHVVPGIGQGRNEVSSRHIRNLLREGKIEAANRLLGYPYTVSGKVVHGSHRGRRIGFPTANLSIDSGKILPPGVFWVKVLAASDSLFDRKALSRAADGVCNIGSRPTFEAHGRMRMEVHILAQAHRLYGKTLRIAFMRKLRGEKRFLSPGELGRQITKDIQKAHLYRKAYFSI